jgi:spore maturation protein CgeB
MKILCVFGRNAYGDATRGEGYEHANFLPALRALGHEPMQFESFDRSAYADFADMNRAFLQAIEEQRPDAVLCVLMGYELWTETLDLARAMCSGPIINWGTDDSWKYEQFARFIAPHVDCYATTSAPVLEQARREGHANFVLTQWAASDAALAAPLPAAQCRYRVSFVGSAYGNRRRWIRQLSRRGIEVDCFGYGWPKGPIPARDIPRIVRESVISLNFGDSGLHLRGLRLDRVRQIKARVFEVPGAGGFLLTEAAAGLEHCYRDGNEIATFRDADELADKIRYYLEHPDERDRIAVAGHEHSLRRHTYTRRFEDLLAQAAQLAAGRAPVQANRTSETALAVFAAKHRPGPALRFLRALLVPPLSLLFGGQRGPRAARRLLFELSWRMAGAKTFSATGWPGRIFYRES